MVIIDLTSLFDIRFVYTEKNDHNAILKLEMLLDLKKNQLHNIVALRYNTLFKTHNLVKC